MKFVCFIATLLVVIGGLNWGLVGIWDLDVVAWLFGDMSTVSRIIYVLVGAAALYVAATKMMKKKQA